MLETMYVGARRAQVSSEKVCGSLGIFTYNIIYAFPRLARQGCKAGGSVVWLAKTTMASTEVWAACRNNYALTNTSHGSGWHGPLEDYFPLQRVGAIHLTMFSVFVGVYACFPPNDHSMVLGLVACPVACPKRSLSLDFQDY